MPEQVGTELVRREQTPLGQQIAGIYAPGGRVIAVQVQFESRDGQERPGRLYKPLGDFIPIGISSQLIGPKASSTMRTPATRFTASPFAPSLGTTGFSLPPTAKCAATSRRTSPIIYRRNGGHTCARSSRGTAGSSSR